MDLKVEQLRRFVILAEELNFTRAAARLHIAQQVLSAQVKALEQAVGVELLNRTTRRVELTVAGDAFLGRARTAVSEADAAVRAARRAGLHEQLLLACEIDAQWALAETLERFAAVDPGVEVAVVYVVDVDTVAQLTTARLDAAAVWGRPPSWLAEHAIQVAAEDIHVVLRDDDPLAGRTSVPVAQLGDRTLWIWPPTVAAQAWQLLVEHVHPDPARVRIVASDAAAPTQDRMVAAVQADGGYTLAPARYLQQALPSGIRSVPLDPILRTPVTLCWQGSASVGLTRLVQFLERGDTAAPLRASTGGPEPGPGRAR